MSRIVKKAISTDSSYKPVAPYSQAIQVGNTLYLSGVVGLDKETGKLVSGGVVPETRKALTHMRNILSAAGTSFSNVVKVSVLLEDIQDSSAVNEVYKEFFREPYPARAAYQVGKLPLGAKIEIEAIAVVADVVST